MTPIRKKLLEIQETQLFEELDSLKDPASWKEMHQDERNLFSKLLLKQGSIQLAKGENKVLETFDLAAKVSLSPSIFFEQGIIFSMHPDNSRCLKLASNCFAKSIEMGFAPFIVWYQWAEALFMLGTLDGEIDDLLEAEKRFEKASTMLDSSPDELKRDFYWKWAVCWATLGMHSGEPIDFNKALQYFRKAEAFGCAGAKFLIDYGNALADLGSLIDAREYFVEALQLFKKATELAPEKSEAWQFYACCLCKLYETTPNDDYLEQAMNSFQTATDLKGQNGFVWLKWAQFEGQAGKLKRSHTMLESSLEKFTKANELEPNHPGILGHWAETELILAFYHERHDLIQSAKAKIIKSLELQPKNSDGWYLYGACLNEMGRYFEDQNYYEQAIEKFQYGLSLKRDNPLLWYGLALSHFALGELQNDLSLVEKSAYYCSRVLEYGVAPNSQFWNDWGVALLKLGEMTNQEKHVEAAIEKFERALKQPVFDPACEDVDLEWVYNYSCALDLLGELNDEPRLFEKAAHILNQILQLDPSYQQARYNLALTLSHLANATNEIETYQKAFEQFQNLLSEDPEDDVVHIDFGICLVNFSLLTQDPNQPSKSENLFRQAELHLMQSAALGNSDAYYLLAGLYSLTGHYHLSMHNIEKALTLKVLPPLEDLLHDEWLEGLRDTSHFKQFINRFPKEHSS